MPLITNIPDAMITEHVNWHTRPGSPALGGRAIDPWPPTGGGPAQGSGEEFLVWHQGYVQRFYDWLNGLPANQRPDASTIQPWTTIPVGLKMGMVRWNATRAQQELQLSDMSNFPTLDALGRFLEWGLHGWLHQASSQMWSEPVLLSFESPRITYFWQLHGLIDHWRQTWVDGPPTPAIGLNELTVDGPQLVTSIGTAGEVDRFHFVAPSFDTYTIETTGATDVVMFLAGPNDPMALVASDDDSGQGRNSRISSQLTAGTYFVYVRHYSRQGVGEYAISVSSVAAASIPALEVNGPETQGNLSPSNESDLYEFQATQRRSFIVETLGNTDTFLTLLGPDDQATVIAEDDDSGPNLLSRIALTLGPGTYFVRVRHYRPTGSGAYRVRVRSQ